MSTTPPDESASADNPALVAELARAEAERDAAVAALDKRGRRQRRRARGRQWVAGFLVVVFAVLLPVTATLTWAHYTVLNTDGFESAVGPLASDPAVTAVVATGVTNQIFAALNAQGRVADALPPKASFLAGPITNGVKGYVQNGVNQVLQSPQWQALWTQSTRFAHSQLVAVLRGHSKAVNTTNGQVVLDVVPLFNAVLQNVQGFASGLIGKPIDLPTITANEVPAAACQKISTALGRPVPATCGQIPLFPAAKLTQARRAVQAFDRVTVLLLILTPALGAVALWVSAKRRRTLLQLGVGGLLGLVVIRRVTIWLQHTLVNTGKPDFKAAREAILTSMLSTFFDATRWLLVALIILVVLTLLSGPYRWARHSRRWMHHALQQGANLAMVTVGRGHDDPTTDWVRSHLDLLRIAGVAIAVILILVTSVSWIGLLIIAILLAAYETGLHQLRPPTPPTPTPQPTTPTTPTTPQ